MTRVLKLAAVCAIAICTSPLSARADHDEFVGRTGLPTVMEGKNKVWMERCEATLEVRGSDLVVTQVVKMRYPGRDIEDESARIKVAVREDHHRSKDFSGDLQMEEAKGFKRFSVMVDGRSAATEREPWMINKNKDTATRWRTWWMAFRPGQVRTMRIVSVSPLGWEGNRRSVEFVSKDLGRWRQSPNYLEIRVEAPGRMETTLAGLEPKPTDQTRRGIRWVYRKASPNRNVFVLLPSTYRTGGRPGL